MQGGDEGIELLDDIDVPQIDWRIRNCDSLCRAILVDTRLLQELECPRDMKQMCYKYDKEESALHCCGCDREEGVVTNFGCWESSIKGRQPPLYIDALL